jgi:hypothetical protein
MTSQSISNEYTFSNFENSNNVRLSSVDSRDEVSSNSDRDSRSNSIVYDDSSKTMKYIQSDQIPIPSPYNARKREVNYDGENISDQRRLTPTPTKYYMLIQENMKKIQKLFTE